MAPRQKECSNCKALNHWRKKLCGDCQVCETFTPFTKSPIPPYKWPKKMTVAMKMKKPLLSVTTIAARVMLMVLSVTTVAARVTMASRPMYIFERNRNEERSALLRVKLLMVATWGWRLLYPDQEPYGLYRLRAVSLSVISTILKMMLSFAP